MILTPSEVDGRRFGLGIVRGRVTDAASAEAAMDELASGAADVAFLRCPSDAYEAVHALTRRGALLVDTLVYYDRACTDAPDGGEPLVREATPDDASHVAAIARESFTGYLGHYHRDPRLDGALATEGYAEWAEGTVTRGDHRVWVADDGGPIGFLSLATGEVPDIVLNAVTAAHRGRGVYGALLRTAIRHAARTGAGRITVSTQLENLAPQRAWAREGFRLARAFHTFHAWRS